ncbi:2Fe-2S iron-sulfur cluster-binding protein [Pedobacter sp. NJ-S-72]
MDELKIIHVNIDYEGTLYKVETFANEYRSLMMLIFDRICPDEFGDCIGMGKCGTCLVEVLDDWELLIDFNRNEHSTLTKHGIVQDGFRLSCQLQINENINNFKF